MPVREGCLEDGIRALKPWAIKRGVDGPEIDLFANTWNPLEPPDQIKVVIEPGSPKGLTHLPGHVHLLFEKLPKDWLAWAKQHKVQVTRAGGLTVADIRKLLKRARVGAAQQEIVIRYLTEDEKGQATYIPQQAFRDLLEFLRIDQQGAALLSETALNLPAKTSAVDLLEAVGTPEALRHFAGTASESLIPLHVYALKLWSQRQDPVSVTRTTRLDFLYDAVYERKLLSHRVAWMRFLHEACLPSISKLDKSTSPISRLYHL